MPQCEFRIAIRTSYYSSLRGEPYTSEYDLPNFDNVQPPDSEPFDFLAADLKYPVHPGHIGHCLDIIRQALMCQGDMSLEPLDILDDGTETVDPWGTFDRECKNWDSITDWMKEHSAPWT